MGMEDVIKASAKIIGFLVTAVLTAAIVGLAGSGAGFAQSGPPVKLNPPGQSVPPQGKSPGGGVAPRGGMKIQNLGGLNPDSVGILDDDKGGLGASLWRGSSRATVAGLLARMPVRYRSPTLRDLATRLLLTQAEAPRGLVVGGSLVTFLVALWRRRGERDRDSDDRG